MSKNISREESALITKKYFHKMFPLYVNFADHEAYHGIWLPKKYESDPMAWILALREVQVGIEEYNEKNPKKENVLIKITKYLCQKFHLGS